MGDKARPVPFLARDPTVQTVSDLLKDRFTEFESYLREGLLPLWRGWGWNGDLGCHERLAKDDRRSLQDFHRLMNLSRQIFVFSSAFDAWRNPTDARHAKTLFNSLTRHFRDTEHGGWYFSIALDGSPKDKRKDLYGHAFLLFALAHFGRVFKSQQAFILARETDDVLQKHLKLDTGWYAYEASEDWQIPDRALRQNPHMHLLEAYLALAAHDQDDRWTQRLNELSQLTEEKLLDRDLCLIREYFDDAAAPCPENGAQVEPGHQFEWSWLIEELAAAVPVSDVLTSRRNDMFRWAEKYGLDSEHGGIFDQLTLNGEIQQDSKRLWPVTEYLKALASQPDLAPVQRQERLAETLGFLMEHYLNYDGSWQEYLNRDLTTACDYLPASSLYHLMMAYKVLRAHID